jgi:peptidoglycan/LPS O-acetylase OafA/YrhL
MMLPDNVQPTSQKNGSNTLLNDRLYYMDNLRALAMFAGIIFHAALAYSPLMHEIYFTASEDNSVLIDIGAYFLHLFRMPVFFLISGFFAMMLIKKRGVGGFIKNRLIRILAPFVLFLPITVILSFIIFGWAFNNIENPSPIMEYILSAENEQTPQDISTFHLWFLYNLFLFCLAIALLYKLRFFDSKIYSKLATTKFIVFVLPFCLVPALNSQAIPNPAADKIYPELWSFGFYGLFFFVGCLIFKNKNLFDELEHYKNWLLLGGLSAYLYYYLQLPTEITILEEVSKSSQLISFSWHHFSVAISEAFTAAYITLYSLLIGKKFLCRQNRILRFISDSSYWIYILHIPILFYIQFLLMDIGLNMWLEFFISVVSTFLIGAFTYVVFVKRTPLGTLLNGKHTRTKQRLVLST